MLTFSIISEGVTDQKVLKNILIGYFDDLDGDKIRFTYDQPQQDETDKAEAKQAGGGGWGKVLAYCASEDFIDSLQFSDYTIIQIDTDRADEFPVDIRGDETIEEVFEIVKAKLVEKMGADIYTDHQQRIFFAISIKALECWLLPIYYNNNRKSSINNCLYLLNQKLPGKLKINTKDKNAGRVYFKISKPYLKQQKLQALYPENPSLALFIGQLESVFSQLP